MRKYTILEKDGSLKDVENPGLMSFGVTEAIGALVASGVGALGVGSATAAGIGSAVGSGLVGSAIGGGLSSLMGGSFGKGAELGGLLGLGQGALSSALGGGAATATPGLGTPSAAGIEPVTTTPGINGENFGGVTPGSTFGSTPSFTNPATSAATKLASGLTGTKGTLSDLIALGSMLSRPNQTVQQGAYFNKPLNTTGYLNRSFNPNVSSSTGNWQTYGEGPEQSFYTGNQLTGMAKGGRWSRGGALGEHFNTHRGDFYVGGSAGGQDDTEPARLSDGEVVFDAGTVSAIGDGNNAAGARRLLEMRKQIAQDKGFKHTVQPKLKKSPLTYLKETQR